MQLTNATTVNQHCRLLHVIFSCGHINLNSATLWVPPRVHFPRETWLDGHKTNQTSSIHKQRLSTRYYAGWKPVGCREKEGESGTEWRMMESDRCRDAIEWPWYSTLLSARTSKQGFRTQAPFVWHVPSLAVAFLSIVSSSYSLFSFHFMVIFNIPWATWQEEVKEKGLKTLLHERSKMIQRRWLLSLTFFSKQNKN